MSDTEKVKNPGEKVRQPWTLFCRATYFLDVWRNPTLFTIVLVIPQILKINNFMSPDLTHVVPFKSFVSLLFGAFLKDFN